MSGATGWEALQRRYALTPVWKLGRRIVGINAVGAFIRYHTIRRHLWPHRERLRRVLDAGCGSGGNLALLRRLAPEAAIHGCDYDERELAKARGRDAAATFERADLTDWAHAASYDLVLNVDVLEHIDQYRAALATLARCVAPGGLLALHVPCDKQRRLLPLRVVKGHRQDDHVREGFDLEALAGEVEALGMRVLVRRRTVGPWGRLIWELDFLCRQVRPLNYLFLPLWKLLVWPDIGRDHRTGNGVFILAEKPVESG